jgi:hypothetical protein
MTQKENESWLGKPERAFRRIVAAVYPPIMPKIGRVLQMAGVKTRRLVSGRTINGNA